MRLLMPMLVLMMPFLLMAEEYPLAIESDLEVEYFVIEKSGTAVQTTLLLKRVRPSGTTYSKRLFDCEARTYQVLGSWESLGAMTATCPESAMWPVEEGTIAYQLWQHACAENGISAKPKARYILVNQ